MSESRIGKYEKLRELGSGFSGVVWLCRSEDGEEVAIKLLNPDLLLGESSLILEMFGNEVEVSENLSHNNIVKLLGHHINDESVYLVMEYVSGGSLEQFNSPSTLLPIPQLIEYCLPVCNAMQFAASNGFIHRDIKPSNIFLTRDNTIKVSDFGAGMRIREGIQAVPEASIGSPAYMSPEHAQNEPMTHQSDIYSFGVTMYRLVAGRLPYFATTDAEMTNHIIHTTPPRPSLFRVELPTHLEEIILKCLEKKPSNRFASWRELETALANAKEIIEADLLPVVDRDLIFQTLRAYKFFEKFTDEQIRQILQSAKVISMKNGHRIIHKGERGKSLYFIVDGSVDIEIDGKSGLTLGAGEIFGELPYLSGDKDVTRMANVNVNDHCTVMMMNPIAIDAMNIEVRLAMMSALCKTLATRINRKSI